MRRSAELATLSREHHVALEVALRLRRATSADLARVRAAGIAFWRDECRDHFRIEEELLVPAFAAHVGDADADIMRLRDEHRALTARFAALTDADAVGVEAVRATGALLAHHVRFEERTLFPRVEAVLPETELGDLARRLQAAERPR